MFGLRDELGRPATVAGDGRDPDIDRIGPGVRRDRRVRVAIEQGAEAIGEQGLADARRPKGRHGVRLAKPALDEPRDDPARPHRAHLARRTGQRHDDPAIGPIDPPARCRPVLVRDRGRRRDQPGLLPVGLRERQAPPLEQPGQPSFELRIDGRCFPGERRDGLPGEVVRGWSEATRGDRQVCPREGRGEGVADRGHVVGEACQPLDLDAALGQVAGQVAGVRVARFADRELGSDRQDLGREEGSHGGAGSIGVHSGGGDVGSSAPRNGSGNGSGDAAASADAAAPTVVGKPLGLRDQVAATIGAGRRLITAHVDLAKAEAGEIAGEVGRLVGLMALALGLLFMVGIMLTLGLLLFLGEWLFGSIGWGVLLGTILLIDLAIVAVLLALAVPGRRIAAAFGTAAVLGIVAALVLGLDLTHRAWEAAATQVLPNIAAGERPRNLAVLSLAAIGAVVGLIGGLRRGGAWGGLVLGAVLGAIVGLVTSAAIAPTIGAAIGVLTWLIAWPTLAGIGVMRTGIDGEAFKQRFMPDQTIELTKETIEWVRARTPLAPKS